MSEATNRPITSNFIPANAVYEYKGHKAGDKFIWLDPNRQMVATYFVRLKYNQMYVAFPSGQFRVKDVTWL